MSEIKKNFRPEAQTEQEPELESVPEADDTLLSSQAAAGASLPQPQQKAPLKKKKAKRRKASQLERIATEVSQSQVCSPSSHFVSSVQASAASKWTARNGD